MTAAPAPGWTRVCPLARLPLERGVTALVGGVAVALVRTHDGTVHAVANLDPVDGAPVMARGIVGTRGGRAVLVSPIHKQAFDLVTGRCLVEGSSVTLPVYGVRTVDGEVEVLV